VRWLTPRPGPVGEKEGSINAGAVTALLEAAGAAAVTIHGRTMEQR
jgi:tRNA-dihydrouridine synthase